jgi:hypothetical protein
MSPTVTVLVFGSFILMRADYKHTHETRRNVGIWTKDRRCEQALNSLLLYLGHEEIVQARELVIGRADWPVTFQVSCGVYQSNRTKAEVTSGMKPIPQLLTFAPSYWLLR